MTRDGKGGRLCININLSPLDIQNHEEEQAAEQNPKAKRNYASQENHIH